MCRFGSFDNCGGTNIYKKKQKNKRVVIYVFSNNNEAQYTNSKNHKITQLNNTAYGSFFSLLLSSKRQSDKSTRTDPHSPHEPAKPKKSKN